MVRIVPAGFLLEQVCTIIMTKYPIKQALLESAQADGILPGKILVGANLSLVQGKHWGMSSTLTEASVHANFVDNPGGLENADISSLIERLNSDRLLESSLGMAALNSVIDLPDKFRLGDAFHEIATVR